LWRLRQRKEATRLRAARHPVIARALGCGLGQQRRLEIDEAVPVEVLAHRARDRVPQPQAILHHVAAQIDVPVLEPDLLLDVLVELDRQRLAAVQYLDLAGEQLDRPRRQVRVGRAGWPWPDRPSDAPDPFAAPPPPVRATAR